MLNRLNITAVTLLVAAACGGSPSDELSPYQRPNGETVGTPEVQMVTMASETMVTLGDTVTVSCWLVQGDEFLLPTSLVTVDVFPAADTVEPGLEKVTFTPATAGDHKVSCRSTDGKLSDPVGITIDVDGYLPASWTVTTPDQECFGQTDRLDIDYSVQDAQGNAVNRAEVAVEIQPNDGVVGNAGTGFRFSVDGEYDVTVSLLGERAEDNTIEPVSFSIRVDATPPTFEITSPARGAMIAQGGLNDDHLAVTGTISDSASAITSLTIDGVAQSISGDNLEETIDASHDSRWGLSVVAGHAEDACGNVAYVTVPYLRSADYYEAATAPSAGATVSRALNAQVSQSFVDDGDRSDLDDLFSVGQVMLDNYDFNGMLAPGAVLSSGEARDDCDGFPGPTFISTGHVASRHPNANKYFNIDPTLGHLSFVSGGVDFGVAVENFDFPLQVQVTVVQCALGAPTVDTITVDAWVGLDRLDANGVVGVNLANGRADASVEAIDFDVEGLYLDIECGMLDWACDGITDLVINAAEEMIEAKVEEAVSEMVPPMLTETLSNVTVETSLELPAPLSTQLNVAAHLGQLSFCGPSIGLPSPSACGAHNAEGAMVMGLETQIYPSSRGSGIPQEARGAIRGGANNPPSFDSGNTSFGAAVNLDALNQALWAVWYGGGIDIPDLKAAMPTMVPEGVAGSVYAGLPPVVMPGRNGNLVELGLGDLQVDASVDVNGLLGNTEAAPHFVDVSMTISAVVGASIRFDEETNAVQITVDPEAQLYFEIHAIDDHSYGQLLGERLGQTLAASLPTLLGDALGAVQLPTFDLSAMDGVPAGTVWGLSNAQVAHTDGFVAFAGVVGPVSL